MGPLGQNLYCFSLYTENTGNETLVSHELELLNIVAAQGKGIFACEQWDVFSDVSVPVDANAVFLPQRLRTWLSSKPGDTPHGLYYENCPYVQYGFFGHLEIITKTAVGVLTANLEECHTAFAPCANDG